MKKTILLSAVAMVIFGCTSRQEAVKKATAGSTKIEVEINGHEYWLPTVGNVSGQSNGYISQLVHNPDCRRCAEKRDSVIRSIIRVELRNFGEEVE
jgi:hypothetical protein